jgi:hypothetical protein
MYIQPKKRISMALISIPSTIGGVTIPGTASSGPLGALFGSEYGLSNLQYPRDLGSMTKGHVVQISLFQRKPQQYSEISSATNNLMNSTKETVLSNAGQVIDAIGSTVSQVFNSSANVIKTPNSSVLSISPEQEGQSEIISLYMPDTVNITNESHYSGVSSLGAVGEALNAISDSTKGSKGIVGKVIGGVTSLPGMALSALSSNPAKLVMATQGLALNPKNQLLFDGIDFRSYQLAFTFTPYSAQEAETVRQIIKTIKKNAAPRIITEAMGMFFVPPSTARVQFLFNGKENPNIARVAESVITTVDVNYAPNGWAAHDNGAPVQTTLTLQLQEIQLIDSKMIEKEGY